MGGYDLTHGYDYTKHWSRRDWNEPRLARGNFADSRREFVHQMAQRVANQCFTVTDMNEIKRLFNEGIEAERYHMAMENLYGFGKRIMENKYDPEIFDGVWDEMLPEFTDAVYQNRRLSLQCATPWLKTKEELIAKKGKDLVDAVYPNGITDEDFAQLKADEEERVRIYCAHEDAWIRRSGGWRGD